MFVMITAYHNVMLSGDGTRSELYVNEYEYEDRWRACQNCFVDVQI